MLVVFVVSVVVVVVVEGGIGVSSGSSSGGGNGVNGTRFPTQSKVFIRQAVSASIRR